jgi:hypothetical protein
MSAVRWSDVRGKHVEAIGEAEVERGKAGLLAQVRAHRLAEMRKRRGLAQPGGTDDGRDGRACRSDRERRDRRD